MRSNIEFIVKDIAQYDPFIPYVQPYMYVTDYIQVKKMGTQVIISVDQNPQNYFCASTLLVTLTENYYHPANEVAGR